MKSEDNIKGFFKNRLQDTTPAEDGWNIPSDDIWDSAKVHFPKKKERRKPFIFFWFGAGVITLLVAAFSIYSLTKTDDNKITATKVESIQLEKNRVETSKNIKLEKEAISETRETVENEKATNVAITKTKEKNIKANPTQKNNTVEQLKSITSIIPNKLNIDKIQKDAIVNRLSTTRNIIGANVKKEEKTLMPSETKKAAATVAENDLLKEALNYEELNLPNLFSNLKVAPKTEEPLTGFKEIRRSRPINKWEIGLTHAPFILPIGKLIEADSVEVGDEVNLDFSYRNINIPVTRRLNRRWSISSGLYLSRLKLGVDFTENEIFEFESDDDLKVYLKDNVIPGAIRLNDSAQEINVEFTPDADIMNGDLLKVEGYIPLKVDVVQIPLLLNYHFGRGNRLEGILHAGVFFNYFKFGLNSLDLKVYKDNQLVSKPVEIEPERDVFYEVSPIIGIGAKYHLSNRFSLGMTARFEITALPLSRIEIGAYYGF